MLGALIQLDDFGFPSLSTDGTHGFGGNFLVLLDDFGSPIFISQRKLMNLWKLLGLIGWFRSPNLINKWTQFNQPFWLILNMLLNHSKHVGVGSRKGLWVRRASNTPYKLCGMTNVAPLVLLSMFYLLEHENGCLASTLLISKFEPANNLYLCIWTINHLLTL